MLWWLNSRTRRITERNLEISFPDMPAERREELARASLHELCSNILDSGRTWLWQPERLLRRVRRISGEEHVQAAVDRGQGTIVMSPHLGNWELINLYLCKKYPVTTLYQERDRVEINDLMRHARERCGAKLVPATAGGVRSLLRALVAGEMISLLPDQVPPDDGGEFAPFFGEPALTMTLVTNLIQRTGARAVCSYCKRVPGGEYEIVFRPADENIYASDSATALAALNKSIEHCVLECPEQYLWAYKRYKKLPNRSKREYFQTS
jgi:KDO2-lipid IV(A) lauroyltransferase